MNPIARHKSMKHRVCVYVPCAQFLPRNSGNTPHTPRREAKGPTKTESGVIECGLSTSLYTEFPSPEERARGAYIRNGTPRDAA